MDAVLKETIEHFLWVLTNEYGAERDIDHDDGGYVLFATEGNKLEEITEHFDFLSAFPEWVIRVRSAPEYWAALYILNNEFAITIIMALKDAPLQIITELE